ncbi:short-subunit dehydrogenase [Fontibacillus solani]|uniref:Short-subunit dehydrogenase n=1 Tax=Fontibacillus solani TaxID=1572857 RepID=A0A7W3SYV2_9BACL|nr:SDR family NAD(P)-dependent oxidoreductase [Fontibacillus solani]MBA9088463.1 short-subunit dehydrogenase [Fontibacillus solani]
MNMKYFEDKNIVVTGAAKGIGKEIAKYFWECGANLFLIDIDEKALSNFLFDFKKAQSKNQWLIFSTR